jgi:hypothetical protein
VLSAEDAEQDRDDCAAIGGGGVLIGDTLAVILEDGAWRLKVKESQ